MALLECWSSEQGHDKAWGNHLHLFATNDFHLILDAWENISWRKKISHLGASLSSAVFPSSANAVAENEAETGKWLCQLKTSEAGVLGKHTEVAWGAADDKPADLPSPTPRVTEKPCLDVDQATVNRDIHSSLSSIHINQHSHQGNVCHSPCGPRNSSLSHLSLCQKSFFPSQALKRRTHLHKDTMYPEV